MDTVILKQTIEQQIDTENSWLEKLNPLSDFYNSFGMAEHFQLSKKIVEKLCFLKKQLVGSTPDALLYFSTMRYCLETLIHTRLLLVEPDYVFKLYYSIYLHQYNKNKNFLSRLEYEIELMEKFVMMEEEREDKLEIELGNEQSDEAFISKFSDGLHSIGRELDAIMDDELTLFFGDFKTNGYAFQKYLMEEKIKNMYLENLKAVEREKKKREKQILKDKRINSLFEFKNQPTLVFKKLKDDRSWDKKAKDVGLEREYVLIYELSSAMVHCTSYSLITPTISDEQEQTMILQATSKYCQEAFKNIKKFLSFDGMSNFKVVNLVD